MSTTSPTAFFAYSSSPAIIGETIAPAVEDLNKSNLIKIKTWEDCKVGGRIIIDVICNEIAASNLFCADLTEVNPNVMFELGFAIATNKRVWLILDHTKQSSKKQFDQLRILTTIGYADYCNSHDIQNKFYKDMPWENLDKTIFKESIESNLVLGKAPTILYLKSRHETEPSRRISKIISQSKIPKIVDDPRESTAQSLTWYGTQVYSAQAVVCHFTNPEREGAQLHNARYALVAGLAKGMDKPLLMLEEGDFFIPIDYRDALQQYQTPSQAITLLENWLNPIQDKWAEAEQNRIRHTTQVTLAAELQGLEVGEYLAENEASNLVEDYFVETTAYREALHGSNIIFVGRKGSGKTANLFKLESDLSNDPRNLVCVIKPIAYELESIVELLRRYSERDQKGYVIESLWKFLIYTEMGSAAIERINNRASGEIFENEKDLVKFNQETDGLLNEDFTIRLERTVGNIINTSRPSQKDGSMEEFRGAISEAIHKGVLSKLRVALGLALKKTEHVAVLVDNLDKAWDKTSNLSNLAQFLLGLLGAAGRIPIEFTHKDERRESLNINLIIFLRSDIFYRITEQAREPDKIKYTKLNWQDPELLLKVIERRFVSSHQGNVSPNEMWEKYFTATVQGLPIKKYIMGRILPRPRDLVFLIKSAVSIALNRGHIVVEESDILEAEKQYSQYALESILVENGITIETLERILYEFAGSNANLCYEDLALILDSCDIPRTEHEAVVEHLCALAFLGVEINSDEYRFAEDFQDYQKLKVLIRRGQERVGRKLNYKINAPFWTYLEIESAQPI